jgi:hypothetical protein
VGFAFGRGKGLQPVERLKLPRGMHGSVADALDRLDAAARGRCVGVRVALLPAPCWLVAFALTLNGSMDPLAGRHRGWVCRRVRWPRHPAPCRE